MLYVCSCFSVTHVLALQARLNTLKLIATRLAICVPDFYRTKKMIAVVNKTKSKYFMISHWRVGRQLASS